MRLSKKLLSLLVIFLLIGVFAANVYADEDEDEEASAQHYQYEVVVYEGDQPGFDSTASPLRLTVDPETQLDIAFNEVTDGYELKIGTEVISISLPKTVNADGQEEDNIYTPIGIKETGNDNAEVIVSLTGDSAKITEDKSYVLTYGMTGTLVDYTVVYQTNTGVELGRADYKGRIGDKPVVAALPFDGYTPDANNRTKTLTADASENVFTFTYYPFGTVTTEEYEYITLDDGTVVAVPTGGGGGGGAPVTPETPEEVPETVDLIDDDIPLAGPVDAEPSVPEPTIEEIEDNKTPLSGWLLGGTIIGSLAILAFFLFLLLRRRKAEE